MSTETPEVKSQAIQDRQDRQERQGNRMSQTNQVASLSSVAGRSARAANKFTPGSGFETKGVHAWFSKHHALADVSLEFPSNTVTALIGPSGCGKTTFLRTLNRMHEFIPGAAIDRKSTRLNSSHRT